MGSCCGRFGARSEVLEDLLDDGRDFDTGNDVHLAAILAAGFDVDGEDASSSKADIEAFVPCKPGT